MKKIFLSLALLSSIPLIPSSATPTEQPAPEQAPASAVQDQGVKDAVTFVEATSMQNKDEFRTVNVQIETVGNDFKYYIPEYERAELIRTLVRLAETGQLNLQNFEQKKRSVIVEIVERLFVRRAEQNLRYPGPQMIGASKARDLQKEMMAWNSARPYIVGQYMGTNAEEKFQAEASLRKYDWYRQ